MFVVKIADYGMPEVCRKTNVGENSETTHTAPVPRFHLSRAS